MNFDAIQNLVKALSKPYSGASTFYKGKEFSVWKIKKGPKEPGKVIEINNNILLNVGKVKFGLPITILIYYLKEWNI